MQMYDRDDPTDNWKTAKCGDLRPSKILVFGGEKANAEADVREKEEVDSHHRR